MTPESAFAKLLANDDIVLDALDRRASETPGRLYIYYGEDDLQFTFQEFKQTTDAIAAGLAAHGLPPGSPVSVLTRNSLLSILSMFAIWRAGGIFAPVNFNFTPQLVQYQLSDTRPFIVITDSEFLPVIQEIRDKLPPFIIVAHRPVPGEHDYKQPGHQSIQASETDIIDYSDLKRSAERVPAIARSPFDDANIVYTSGTTGRSKGVRQAFRWMSYYAQLQYIGYTPDDVIYCDLPMYHVAGAFALTTRALWAGCTIGIWDKFSPTRFWERIRKIGASNAILMDVMISWLMAAPACEMDRHNSLNKVHMQPLPQNHNEIAKRFGFDIITCGYGQTESGSAFFGAINELDTDEGTPAALWRGLPKGEYLRMIEDAGAAIRQGTDTLPRGFMGRPNPLLEIAVLDDDDNHRAKGEVGQLCYRPRYPGLLLKGYFNNPAASAEVLRNCWYHTGDAGYESTEFPGTYVFVDRMGGFLRVKGENISSFEVEFLIGAHPAIKTCAAIPVPAAEGDEDDIAVFVELKNGEAPRADELMAFADEHCPKYMRPKYLRIVDALPTTPTNKVEKYKLRELLQEESADGNQACRNICEGAVRKTADPRRLREK